MGSAKCSGDLPTSGTWNTAAQAANWIPLGQTQGRGRMDRCREPVGFARKLLFVYPLYHLVQQRLREAQPPCFSEGDADADWA